MRNIYHKRLKLPLIKAGLFSAMLFPAVSFAAAHEAKQQAEPLPHPPPIQQASITPTVGFRHAERPAVILDAEFLWWFGEVSNLSYAIRREGTAVDNDPIFGTRNIIAPTKKEHFEWEWNPGVRLGLGVITDLDGWDLYSNWTYYYTKDSQSKNVAAPTTILSFGDVNVGQELYTSPWLIEPNANLFNSISGRFSLSFNQIDLELGRNFWISDEISVRPMAGLRGYWADLRFKVQGSRPSFVDGFLSNSSVNESADYKQDSWAVGLLSGLSSAWHITRHFSLYGELELALAYGKTSIQRNASIFEYTPTGNRAETDYSVVTRDRRYLVQPFIDLGLGIRFENNFESIRAMLDLGWEFHSLLKFNQLFRGTFAEITENNPGRFASDLPSANGNLSLSGFVARGRLEF